MSIKLSNIYHTYSKGTPFERLALNDVSLEISKGEIVAIIGHTGSGKSTLVQHLNGLLKPDKGSASIDDINITCLLYTSPSPRDRSLSRMPSSA